MEYSILKETYLNTPLLGFGWNTTDIKGSISHIKNGEEDI